jgi:hypothetical protein
VGMVYQGPGLARYGSGMVDLCTLRALFVKCDSEFHVFELCCAFLAICFTLIVACNSFLGGLGMDC